MLRKTGDDDELILVCDCYSHGFMKSDQFEIESVSMFGYRRSRLDWRPSAVRILRRQFDDTLAKFHPSGMSEFLATQPAGDEPC
jgi:hypothetical protein